MKAPRPYDFIGTFIHSLDSVCISLQLTLDKDDASDEPMDEKVRVELEKELKRATQLKDQIREAAALGPKSMGEFVGGRKAEFRRMLDFYETRLRAGIELARSDSYNPGFDRTRRALELVELARQSIV